MDQTDKLGILKLDSWSII